MCILFAAPDRDLLACYESLLTADFGRTVTAFDGARVLTLLGREPFDLAILDESLPRVSRDRLLSGLGEKGVPVILLTDRRVGETPGARAVLRHPFTPDILGDAIRAALGPAEDAPKREGDPV